MPAVVNGTGTWFYGKRNPHVRTGACSSCGAATALHCYDTTKYVTVLYVPLFPISSWRVIDECQSCKVHRAVKMNEWTASKAQAVGSITDQLASNRNDPQYVIEALTVAVAFQDQQLYRAVPENLASGHEENVDVQLALGEAAEFFGDHRTAAAAYQRALTCQQRASDSPTADKEPEYDSLRYAYGRAAVAAGKTKSAEHAISSRINAPDADATIVPLLTLLADGYLREGAYHDADRLYDRVEEVDPDAATDKRFLKLRKTAERYRKSGKRLAATSSATRAAGTNSSGAVARFVGPILAIALVGLYLGVAVYKGRSRTVHLVSGMPVSYTATVGSETYELKPWQIRKIQLKEGTYPVVAELPFTGQVAGEAVVETNFFSRPFVSTTVVINPDQSAFIAWSQAAYSESGDDEGAESRYYCGRTCLVETGIDYVFREFPDEITIDEGRVAYREQVQRYLADDLSLDWKLEFLADMEDRDEDATLVLSRLALEEPSNANSLYDATAMMEGDAALAFLDRRRETRPLLADWHLHYIGTWTSEFPGEPNVVRDYYRRLAHENPDNPSAQMLAGRAFRHRIEAREYLDRAVELQKPFVAAQAERGFMAFAQGRFQDAIDDFDEVETTNSSYGSIYWYRSGAEKGLGNWLQARGFTGNEEEDFPDDDWSVYDFQKWLEALALEGRLDQALAAIEKHGLRFANEPTISVSVAEYITLTFPSHQFGRYLRGRLAYLQGDVAAWAETLESLVEADPNLEDADHVAIQMEIAKARGDFETAVALLPAYEDAFSASAYTLLEVALTAADDPDRFQPLYDRALNLLSEGDASDRAFASVLTAEGSIVWDDLQAVLTPAYYKTVILTAAAVMLPEIRSEAVPAARKLNFDFDPPKHLVDRVLDGFD